MQLLAEREKTHGDYKLTAQTAQTFKIIFQRGPSYKYLTATQKESLDMIAVKLARVVCGDPNEPDHWRDIAGYAQLIAGDDNGRN